MTDGDGTWIVLKSLTIRDGVGISIDFYSFISPFSRLWICGKAQSFVFDVLQYTSQMLTSALVFKWPVYDWSHGNLFSFFERKIILSIWWSLTLG